MKTPRVFSILLITIAVGWCGTDVSAQWVIGRYAGEFLSLGAGARALAMGGASTALPTPATAGYYNPSALAGIDKRYIEFMHASQFDNLYTYDYLSHARPLPDGLSGALTVLYTRVSGIPITKLSDPSAPLSDNNPVLSSEQTGDHELALMASAAKPFKAGWKAGANAKLLMKSVAGESAFGLGFDLGMSRPLGKQFNFGVCAHDVTTSVLAWSTGRTESILPTLTAGGAWSAPLKALNAQVTVTTDLETRFESRGNAEVVEAGPISVQPRVGLEYLIADAVALRGGYDGDNITAGAGIRFSWLSVSAAFQNHSDLGFTHRVSAGIVW
jgi:hypothetical protein